MGKEIAKVGDYEATTMAIKEYDTEINQIPFKVIDTPGLCDDLEELENDYKYLEMMRSQVKRIDCMWFVSRLDETRVTNDEKRGIKLISEAFGADVWQHAVIVFTFANSVPSHRYLYEILKCLLQMISFLAISPSGSALASTEGTSATQCFTISPSGSALASTEGTSATQCFTISYQPQS